MSFEQTPAFVRQILRAFLIRAAVLSKEPPDKALVARTVERKITLKTKAVSKIIKI